MAMTVLEALNVLLNDEHLDDFVYYVRDIARESQWPPKSGSFWEGNSWHHPRVENFSKAVSRLKELQKELKTQEI